MKHCSGIYKYMVKPLESRRKWVRCLWGREDAPVRLALSWRGSGAPDLLTSAWWHSSVAAPGGGVSKHHFCWLWRTGFSLKAPVIVASLQLGSNLVSVHIQADIPLDKGFMCVALVGSFRLENVVISPTQEQRIKTLWSPNVCFLFHQISYWVECYQNWATRTQFENEKSENYKITNRFTY